MRYNTHPVVSDGVASKTRRVEHDAGSVQDVRDQIARKHNAVLRRKCVAYLKALFRTINNIILQRTGKRREQRTVTSYADNQRLILFGVLLCV